MSQQTEQRRIGTCESCSFEPVSVEQYGQPELGESMRWLCEICSHSLISTHTNPRYEDDNSDIAAHIGWIGNYLAKLIKDTKRFDQILGNRQ